MRKRGNRFYSGHHYTQLIFDQAQGMMEFHGWVDCQLNIPASSRSTKLSGVMPGFLTVSHTNKLKVKGAKALDFLQNIVHRMTISKTAGLNGYEILRSYAGMMVHNC